MGVASRPIHTLRERGRARLGRLGVFAGALHVHPRSHGPHDADEDEDETETWQSEGEAEETEDETEEEQGITTRGFADANRNVLLRHSLGRPGVFAGRPPREEEDETEEWQYEDETEEEQGIKGQGIHGHCIEGCNEGARHQRH